MPTHYPAHSRNATGNSQSAAVGMVRRSAVCGRVGPPAGRLTRTVHTHSEHRGTQAGHVTGRRLGSGNQGQERWWNFQFSWWAQRVKWLEQKRMKYQILTSNVKEFAVGTVCPFRIT